MTGLRAQSEAIVQLGLLITPYFFQKNGKILIYSRDWHVKFT